MLLPHFMMGQSAIGLVTVTLETGRNITSASPAAATIEWTGLMTGRRSLVNPSRRDQNRSQT